MTEQNWTLKQDISQVDPEDLAKIACALKSLSIYTSLVCDQEDSPEDLEQIVNDGLEAMERVFNY